MSGIYQFIVGFVLNKIWGVAIDYFSGLIAQYKRRKEYKKLKKDNQSQAKKLADVATEIRKLQSEGKEVPEELKQSLRNEASSLIDGTFDPDSHKL